jgi:hypothetical protein
MLTTLLLVPAVTTARDVYVAPTGTPQGDGSEGKPLDFATALSSSSDVQPGDTVWLAAGTYKGPFTKPAEPSGMAEKPIIYRARSGQRATLTAAPSDDNILAIHAAHTWFWGLELTHNGECEKHGGIVNLRRGDGIRLINLVIHDNPRSIGIGGWDVGSDHDYYGCIVYRNGRQIGHPVPHGIYTQNTKAHTTKKIRECLFFNNFGFGVHCYGEAPELANYLFEGVAAWGNGMPKGNDGPMVNFLVGGKKPSDAMVLRDCFTFFPDKGDFKRGADFGYRADNNGSLSIEHCMFVGGEDALQIRKWQRVTFQRNFCYTTTGHALVVESPSAGLDREACTIDNNTCFDCAKVAPFKLDAAEHKNLTSWCMATRWDKHSRLVKYKPTQPMVFLRPNEYEPDRAHLIVYNWPGTRSVPVDLGKLWDIKKGQRYSIVNVEDMWGKPDARGVFSGEAIRVPLSGSYAPAFACYLVTRSAAP